MPSPSASTWRGLGLRHCTGLRAPPRACTQQSGFTEMNPIPVLCLPLLVQLDSLKEILGSPLGKKCQLAVEAASISVWACPPRTCTCREPGRQPSFPRLMLKGGPRLRHPSAAGRKVGCCSELLLRVELGPPNSYVRVLNPRTSELSTTLQVKM